MKTWLGRLDRKPPFLAALSAIIAVSLIAEFGSYARPDIGFLLDAAGRVLDGAKLYVDVVEINPPLIVALNVPAVLVARALQLSEILVYRVGFTLLLLGSLALCARQTRYVLPDDLGLRRLLLVLIAFILFPLSAQDFGQREHLLLAAAIPYLLLAARRVLEQPVPRWDAIAVGAFAAIGFALKPHFLLLWVGIEASLRLAPPRIRSLLPETVAISIMLAAYGLAIVIVTPQYFQLLQLLAVPYSRFLHDSFFHLLITGPGAPLSLLALLAFVALRRRASHRALWNVLALGVLACFFAAAAQQKGLRYHFYPSFALAVVLLGVVATDVLVPLGRGVERVYRVVAMGATTTVLAVVLIQNAGQAFHLGSTQERDRFGQLVELVRQRGNNGRLYVMSYHIGSTYPLVNYSGVPSASRFPQLWILAAEYLDALKTPPPLAFHDPKAMPRSERYLNEAVLTDLTTQQPSLLVVLRHARDVPVNAYRRINYLAYFARDPRFTPILDRYQWLADIGDYAVYERIPEGQRRAGPAPSTAPGTQDVVRADREGLRLRLDDPWFMLSAVVFFVTLFIGARRSTGWGQPTEL